MNTTKITKASHGQTLARCPDGKVLGGKKIDIQILMAIFNLNKNIGN